MKDSSQVYLQKEISSTLLDEVDKYSLTSYSNPQTSISKDFKATPLNIFNKPIGTVTSRDQIIDPYAYVNSADYGTSTSEQIRYKEDLARYQRYAEMQEASYQEWYNSTEQQVLRERQAGRNPDLTDVIGSEASDTAPAEVSPMDGAQTPLQEISSVVGSFSSLISMVSGVASLPATIASSFASANAANASASFIGSQTLAQDIANEMAIEKGVFNHVSGLFANALSLDNSVNINDWLSNPDNLSGVYELFASSENPRYRAAFQRGISNVLKVRSAANKISADTISSQSSLARLLADPYTDENLVLQVAYMEPLMDSLRQLEALDRDYQIFLTQTKDSYLRSLDPVAAAEYSNAHYKYQTEYFNNLDGSEVAATEIRLKVAESIIKECESNIYSNYNEIYDFSPDTYLGMRAGSIIMGATPMDFTEWLKVRAFTRNPYASPKQPTVGRSPYNSLSADEWLHKSMEEGWLID